jgi:peptidoglycan/xylan/chitin deacetylase (PgdA/CDA1 family)
MPPAEQSKERARRGGVITMERRVAGHEGTRAFDRRWSKTRLVAERCWDFVTDPRLYQGAPTGLWRALRYGRPPSSSVTGGTLTVCLTVDVEEDWRTPGETAAAEAFLPRFRALAERLGWAATLYVQGSIVPRIVADLHQIDHSRFELGLHGLEHEVWGRARWWQYTLGYPSLPLIEKTRRLEQALTRFRQAGLPRPISFRAPYLTIDTPTLRLLSSSGFSSDSSPASYRGVLPLPRHEAGLWRIPVTARPYPMVLAKGLQFLYYPELTVANLDPVRREVTDSIVSTAVHLQQTAGVPPHLVLLMHPWEFLRNPRIPHAGEENYERLVQWLDGLAQAYTLRLNTVSRFVRMLTSPRERDTPVA